jgi:hypothetical protein
MKKLRSARIAVVAMAFMLLGGAASASAAEFHSEGPGYLLTRANTLDDATFKLQGVTITCDEMGNLGETTGASMPSVELNLAFQKCDDSVFSQSIPTWNTNGCLFKYHASGTVDLKSCQAGGIVFEWSLPFIFKCKVIFPNQTGMTGITYTNAKYEGSGTDFVRFDQSLSLTANVVISTGACPLGGEGVPATFSAVSEVAAGGTGLSIG